MALLLGPASVAVPAFTDYRRLREWAPLSLPRRASACSAGVVLGQNVKGAQACLLGPSPAPPRSRQACHHVVLAAYLCRPTRSDPGVRHPLSRLAWPGCQDGADPAATRPRHDACVRGRLLTLLRWPGSRPRFLALCAGR